MNILAWYLELKAEAESRRVILFSISVRVNASLISSTFVFNQAQTEQKTPELKFKAQFLL